MSHLRFGQSEDDWRHFHNISIHNVDDSMPWPQSVRHLAQFFDAPLPGWLVTGPHPFVSEDASDLLCEVLRQSVEDPSILLDYSCTDPAAHPIGKAFDLISSSVAILRQIKSREIPGEHRITTPLWTSMIRAVSRVCMPECVSTCETRFALPRVAHPESHPFVQLEAQEGLATLLISYVGDITLSTDAEECDEQSDVVDDPMSVDSDAEAEPRESLQEEDEEDGGNSQDLFYNAHVLEPPSDSAVMVPIICVAYPEEIIPLLASVLYQRWVWDIVEPVVGITFPKTGAVGQVIFAWLGPTDGSGVDLPIVNLSFGSCRKVHHDHGVFDLSDAVSALRLSNFLSNLSEHFSKIRSATDQRGRLDESALARKSWRADLVEKSFTGSREERERRIDMWRRAVPDSRITDPFSPLDAEMAPKSKNTGKGPSASRNVDNKTGGDRSIQFSDATGGASSQSRRTDKSDMSLSAYACSQYAAVADEGVVNEPSMTNWLLERRALSVARIEGDPEMNKIITIYNDYTELRWPVEWTSEDKMPPVDAGVDSHRKDLFNSGKQYASELPSDVFEIVNNCLSSLLWAADGASIRHARGKNTGALEADRRLDFDSLLIRFFRRNNDINIDVLLERTLRLARNPDHDLMRADIENTGRQTVDTSLTRVVNLYEAQCLADTMKARASLLLAREALKQDSITPQPGAAERLRNEIHHAENAFEQAIAALDLAKSHSTNLIRRDLIAIEDFLKSLEARSIKEPHTGVCDAIGVVGIPKFSEGLPADVQSFARDLSLVTQPAKDSKVSDLVTQLEKARTSPAKPELPVHNLRPLPEKSEKGKWQDPELKVNKEALGLFHSLELRSLAPEDHQPSTRYQDLQLPVLLVEYKKLDPAKVHQAKNQYRQYSVSSVTFLKTIGILDFPVFGLVTDGPIGVVSCTWYSRKNECIYVMERNGRAFDIRTPLGAYHCATFFATLATKHVPELRKKYSEAVKKFKDSSQDDKKKQLGEMIWIKSKQCEQYNLHPKSESKAAAPEVSPSLTD